MQASRGPSVTSAAAAGPAELWEGISSGPRNQPTLRHGCCRQPTPETCRQKGAVKRHQGGQAREKGAVRRHEGGQATENGAVKRHEGGQSRDAPSREEAREQGLLALV